jgi:2-alkenal reductase
VPDRLGRIVLIVAVLLLAAFVAEPYIARLLYTQNSPRAVSARGDLAAGERSTVEVFERASPSVVHVFALSRANPATLGGDDEGGGGQQTGTGFVWDAAGHVVTNNHVVQNAGPVAIRLGSGEVGSAEVVGTAPNYDLAVLRIGRVRKPPPPIAIGTSRDLKVGQAAYAIGNPFGLDQTLTTGVISALQRRLPTGEGRELADVIQTDAAINPGNSGGPLLDSAGRVIGVNTAIFSPSGTSAGIGFAIPVDVVNRVVPELIRNGRMPQPGIGIIAGAEAASARLGVPGVVVMRTLPGSPAARAGLRGVDPRTGAIGDVIVGANGRPVTRLADLLDEVQKAGLGGSVQVEVLRGGRTERLGIEIADLGPGRR